MSFDYSVLMSVYCKEKPDYLKQSMLSIYNQSIKPNDFVLVCDGPLTQDLYYIIDEMKLIFGDVLNILKLEYNVGLGNALNYGLKYCKNEFVARMDSDDISRIDRCEKQLLLLNDDNELIIVSGTISEFDGYPSNIVSLKKVPQNNYDIINYSKKRNPINHPCVMFRKSFVEMVGGYQEKFHLFEDYYLWIRILKAGGKAYNFQEVLLDMRISDDLFYRRGGIGYLHNLLNFHKWMRTSGWCNYSDYVLSVYPHMIVCIIPNIVRKYIYRLFLRS